ncbi:MAG TPA: helix-turn-helix transcriptional regulator [Acidobacteriaceae bacterium]|jgi:DNA-binding transcriptional regulator YiaG|nr:helix-turn-helix transcriptional regulator [Acidobacteriaceae bacterium]
MNYASRNTLLADDLSKLLFDRLLDAPRLPAPVSDFPDMLRRDPQTPCDSGVEAPVSGRLLEFGPNLRKITGGNERHCESENILDFTTVSRENVHPKEKADPQVSRRIRELREQLGLNQTEFAARLGTVPSSVSKWEAGRARPLPEMMVALARLSDGAMKLFFLEKAGVPDAFFMGDPMLPEMLHAATATIARALPKGNSGAGTIEDLPAQPSVPTIPLIRIPSKVGTREAVLPGNVEAMLPLLPEWMPDHGFIQAARFPNPGSLFIQGDLIGLIDVNRRDPDRLVGCVVAIRSDGGLKPMTLRKDGPTYLLDSLQAGAGAQVLRHSGEGSIVGRIIKWIVDTPAPPEELPRNAEIARKLRKRA